ncbi:MAG: TIGR02206 family membrane protein [Planctomycetota bacterium]|nr:TIGR02206 family membrane protein [Planctomycetota bacterium]
MDTFAPFTLTHAATVAVCSLIIVALCLAGRNPRREPAVRRIWVRGIVMLQIANIIYFASKTPLDLSVALPLHVCDLMGWVAAWSLSTNRRVVRASLVFIGLVLCNNAFATPILTEGPATFRFWLFFGTHLQIIGSGLYEIFVRGYRPSARDAANVFGVLVVYAAVMVPLNLATGWNYGYVGLGKPGTPTIVDVLGHWPGRLLVMAVIVVGSFAGFTLLVNAAAKVLDRRGKAASSP